MDGAFNYKSSRTSLRKMFNKLWDTNEEFANMYFQLLLSRRDYHKDSDMFSIAEEVLTKAYKAIGNDEIVNHIHRFNFSYQEFYCADEVVAIMSYYKPNTRPYLEMLRSL